MDRNSDALALQAEVERLRAEGDARQAQSEHWAVRAAEAERGWQQAEARLAKVVVLLRAIAEGAGPFSRDPLEHASNTIDAMKSLAESALAAAQPEEKP